MEYSKLIKKTIIVSITVILTLTILWITFGLIVKSSMKEVPVNESLR